MPQAITTTAALTGALGLLLSGSTSCGGSGSDATATPAAPPQLNVLIVLLDAARADHFGAYGYGRPTTPRFDRLAKESVLFTEASSNASYTLASVASLFSGQPPKRHSVLGFGSVLSERIVTLAEVLQESGYQTAAFTENPLIDREHGYAQGFGKYRLLIGDQVLDYRHKRRPDFDLAASHEHVAEMLRWVDQQSDAPFFLYAHFLRPHNPYTALPEHVGRFTSDYQGSLRGGTREMTAINFRHRTLSDRDLRHLTDLYDENLLSADALLGELVDAFRERHLLESTIVVVLSDHGEALWEHGWLLHGFDVYQEDVHIPFLMRFPASASVPTRPFRMPVQLMDLMPTLAGALGIEIPAAAKVMGRNLMPALRSDESHPPEQAIISHGLRAISIREGPLKLIRKSKLGLRSERRGSGKNSVEASTAAKEEPPGKHLSLLFDLTQDPGEQKDLARSRSIYTRRLRDRLTSELEARKAGALAAPTRVLSETHRAELEALGYINSDSPVAEP